ncbi:unnamed protein product [Mytilus coruscus]|uniref:EGF-like domain-containing protein n=1 Tax=Mytilus coruscus TaxID=42192 RepID=A0A6J8AP34_MYTCO|nr:unnamed protein product [Mytilus coruscus]
MKVTCLHLVLVGITLVFVSITSIHCENNQDCINCSDGCNNQTGYCNGSCLDGYYGSECNSTCPNNCYIRCYRNKGECTYCKKSYYGINCTETCPERCYNNYCNQSGFCTFCKKPFYGYHCEKNCPSNCREGNGCDQHTGECTYGCNDGFWGKSCENNCNDRCESSCEQTHGICQICKPGYGGYNCQLNCVSHCDSCNENDTCFECSKGWFGDMCDLKCPVNCRNSKCFKLDGSFTCSKGWYGKDCHQRCIGNCDSCIDNSTCNVCSAGYYGRYCESSCPTNCTECTRDGEKCTGCNSSNTFGDQCTCNVDQCSKHESVWHCVECKNAGWYPKIGGCCRCSDNCKGGHFKCDNTTGVCLDGCEPGYYGKHCVDKCSSHCIGNDTVCNSTTGLCPYGCEPDWYYSTCKYGCSLLTPHCAKCTQFKSKRNFEYASCDACDDGFYKPVLQEFCTPCENCLNDKCNGSTGDCLEGCNQGWYLNPYRFRKYCLECGTGCSEGLCDPTNGTCIHGCKDGLRGDTCYFPCSDGCLNATCDQLSGDCFKCKPGLYGNKCYYGCGNCLGGTCNETTGICEDGCKDGFFGPKCSKSCSQCMGLKCDKQGVCLSGCFPGKFGSFCNETCADKCLICHPVTGQCLHVSPSCNSTNCTMNFTNSVCPPGKFGFHCNHTCSIKCSNRSFNGYICEKYSGSCIETCATGQFGLFCNASCGKCASADNTLTSCNPVNGSCVNCLKGNYGKQCFQKCNESCFDRDCNGDGVCSHGCESGWEGTFCEVKKPAEKKRLSSGSVTGIAIGCVVAVILTVSLAYFIYRRRYSLK